MSMTMKPQAVVAEASGISGFHIVPSLAVCRVCATNHPVSVGKVAQNVIGAAEK
jgi:hypothetical protein